MGDLAPATWNVESRNRVRGVAATLGPRRTKAPERVIDPSDQGRLRTSLPASLGDRLPEVREMAHPTLTRLGMDPSPPRSSRQTIPTPEFPKDGLNHLRGTLGGTPWRATRGPLRQKRGSFSAFHHGRFWAFSSSNRRRRSIRRFTRRISRRCMPSNSRWSCRRLIRSSLRLVRAVVGSLRSPHRECRARMMYSRAAARAWASGSVMMLNGGVCDHGTTRPRAKPPRVTVVCAACGISRRLGR